MPGVPSITYLRVLSPPQGQMGDVLAEGNTITVVGTGGDLSSRHEVAQVLYGVADEEACELSFGSQAGSGMGAALNPITACVNDAVNAVIFIVGSVRTNKSAFMKRTVLPFVANELFANIAEKDQTLANCDYRAQVTLSAFELQAEQATDLLRPTSQLQVVLGAEGVTLQGVHAESAQDELTLRRLLVDACDNRASHIMPPGASIDTSSAVFEFTIQQSEARAGGMGMGGGDMGGGQRYQSRLLVVEVPATDGLSDLGSTDSVSGAMGGDDWDADVPVPGASGDLHLSLRTLLDVTSRLNTPARAATAPHRASQLTHYLSELLGGNAIVVALASVAQGDAGGSRNTLQLLSALSTALHFPIAYAELSPSVRGLFRHFRGQMLQLQGEVVASKQASRQHAQQSSHLHDQILTLQRDLAAEGREKFGAVEDRERVFALAELLKKKYADLTEERVAQGGVLAESREDNMLLARTLMDKNLALVAVQEGADKEAFELSAALLAAQGQIAAQQGALEGAQQREQEILLELSSGEERLEVLRGEVRRVALELQESTSNLRVEKAKTQELAAELINLVACRDSLEREVEAL
ncbi:hypothetical protein B484DRAFT_397849, partial [Ochromonadaceae sp. CCMP2298]